MNYIDLFKRLVQVKGDQSFISNDDLRLQMDATKDKTEKGILAKKYIKLTEDEIGAIRDNGISQLLDDPARGKYEEARAALEASVARVKERKAAEAKAAPAERGGSAPGGAAVGLAVEVAPGDAAAAPAVEVAPGDAAVGLDAEAGARRTLDLSFARGDIFNTHVILYALSQDKWSELVAGDKASPQENLEANIATIRAVFMRSADGPALEGVPGGAAAGAALEGAAADVDRSVRQFEAHFNRTRNSKKGEGEWFSGAIKDFVPRIELLAQESFRGFEHLLDSEDSRLATKVLKDHELLTGRGGEFKDLDGYIDGLCRVKFADSYAAIERFAAPRGATVGSAIEGAAGGAAAGLAVAGSVLDERKKIETFIVDYYKAYSKGTNVSQTRPIKKGIKLSIDSILSRPTQEDALPDISVGYKEKAAPGGAAAGSALEGEALTPIEAIANEATKGYSLKMLPKTDLRGYYLGAISNSCQSMHGHGSDFARLGMEDPRSGFYVLEKDNRIVGQAFSWKGQDGKSLVFDSIETLGEEHHIPASILFRKLAIEITDRAKFGIDEVRIGLGGQTPSLFGVAGKGTESPEAIHPASLREEKPINFYDSERQVSITRSDKALFYRELSFELLASKNTSKKVADELYKSLDADGTLGRDKKGDEIFLLAAKYGNKDLMDKLIGRNGEGHLDAKDTYDMTPLHEAARYGQAEIVKFIAKARPAQLYAKNLGGHTPLHYAAGNGHPEVVKLIVEIDQRQLTEKDQAGKTAMHYAARDGHTEIVKFIDEKDPGQLAVKDKDGKTAIHYAAEYGHTEIVKFIDGRDRDQLSLKDGFGKTAMHYVAEEGHLEVVKFIAERDPDQLYAKTSNGLKSRHFNTTSNDKTAMHYAAERGHTKIVKFIYENAPAQLAATDKDLNTALHLAVKNGHTEIVQLLIKEMTPEQLSARDKNGNTAFHLAAENGHTKIVQLIAEKNPLLLKEKGFFEKTPIHIAAEHGHTEIVRFIAERAPEQLAAKDNYGMTPLHNAASRGHTEVVEYIYGKDPSQLGTRDNFKRSALFFACDHGHTNIVKFIAQKDPDQLTQLQYADKSAMEVASGHPEIAEYIRDQIRAQEAAKASSVAGAAAGVRGALEAGGAAAGARPERAASPTSAGRAGGGAAGVRGALEAGGGAAAEAQPRRAASPTSAEREGGGQAR